MSATIKKSVGEAVEKLEPLSAVGRSTKRCSRCAKQLGDPTKSKNGAFV